MGDITLKTPLDQGEAPFVWLATAAGFVLVSFFPLRDIVRRNAGQGPLLVSYCRTARIYVALAAVFWLLFGVAFWGARGGHLFVNRISVTVLFWCELVFFAAWSWVYSWSGSDVIGLLALIWAAITAWMETIFIFASGSWWAGGVSVLASLTLTLMCILFYVKI